MAEHVRVLIPEDQIEARRASRTGPYRSSISHP